MDDGSGIPEDLRCKRSDGKQWRCSAMSMPDKTVCEKHYIQAKKRAANSALRASLKKAKRKSSSSFSDHHRAAADVGYADEEEEEEDREMSLSPLNTLGGGGEHSSPGSGKRKGPRGQGGYSPDVMGVKGSGSSGRMRLSGGDGTAPRDLGQFEDNRVGATYNTPPRGKVMNSFGRDSVGECSGRSTDSSGEAEGLTCHQCRRNDRVRVLWCMSCDRRGYCNSCIARWYVGISMEDVRRACPSCRGICSCATCRRGDSLIKARIREVSSIDKLQYLHSLLSFVLPVLKRIHAVQSFELDVETRVYGIKSDIPRARINPDEQMCCDICGMPIVDYHRHCANCLTDLCLDCCHDIRRAGAKEEFKERDNADRGQGDGDQYLSHPRDSFLDFSTLFPRWKAKRDGSIPCPGDRCSSQLVLRRIFKINWVSKLVKNAEEMVSGCRVSDLGSTEKCLGCPEPESSLSGESSGAKLLSCSHREDHGNFLYNPASQDIRHQTVSHFCKHWIKGEPVIVSQVVESSLTSSWEPRIIWRDIKDMADWRTKDDIEIVKAVDCLTQSEIEIELGEFIRKYSEGHAREDGTKEMLKLKDWPSSDALDEFLVCQRPEILKELPLLEYIHSKWGLLNLAAKLPHDTLQFDSGPKLYIAYGTNEELGQGDSVTNLNISISDSVYLLLHTAEVNFQCQEQTRSNKTSLKYEEPDLNGSPMDEDVHFNLDGGDNGDSSDSPFEQKDATLSNSVGGHVGFQEKHSVGVIWDVFRRQDIQKLNEFLSTHLQEVHDSGSPASSSTQVRKPVYDQAYFLHSDQKRKLKEELGIEPWTFTQHVGEAVFIPAGCAFQLRNLSSTVQLALNFLSPESLSQSMLLAQEIRCLPNDHVAKLQMLEVGKMPLYAASWAIREIQKMVLDPKLGSELGFEDQNLTAAVSDNLQKISKRSRVACA